MRFTLAARAHLDVGLARIRAERLVVVDLSELADLVREPESDPFADRPFAEQSGVEELGSILMAVRRLPDDIVVRAVLPPTAAISPPVTEVEAALHRRALSLSSVAWREAMAVRSTGLAQLPAGMAIAIVCWIAAYVFGYLATKVDGGAAGLLAVTAVLVVTISWVVSWVIVEAAVLDWRPPARQAAAYDLLSRARLEVTMEARTPSS
jgi:uncharacterized membrane protein (DUF485 family)